MPSLSRKRSSPEQAGSEKRKRARTQQHESLVVNSAGANSPHVRTPSPVSGVKRTSTDLTADEEDKLKLTINSRAIYEENKQEIDKWYDEEYSHKLGIPKHNKVKHSSAKWFEKAAAWMRHTGLAASPPTKKRKLNNGTAASSAQPSEPRPHQIRWPGDLIAVPEYPFEKLEDYETMPNGRYPCGHSNRNPPADCCIFGVDRYAKRQAIKKSVDRWRRAVEKYVDEKKLDERHKTWSHWCTPALKAKYQPGLCREQQDRKAEKAERERKALRQWYREKREARIRSSGEGRRAELQQPARATKQHHSSAEPNPICTQPPVDDNTARPIAHIRRRSNSKDIAAAQAAFLTELARTNPGQLRAYSSLYQDAQYREIQKDAPNFSLLKKWYLAYFLQQKGQPLSTKQRALLGSGDPSNIGSKRAGRAHPQVRIDGLFDEYLRAAKTENDAQRAKRTLLQAPPSVEATVVRRPVLRTERGMSHATFEIWDHETIDSELDRILASGYFYPAEPAAQTAALVCQETTALQSECFCLSSTPQSFATGNEAVDDEVQKLLVYAYQTDFTKDIAENEQLLRQTIEADMADWQRYCGIYADEDAQSIN